MRKSTWVLLVIVAALGALIFFWERKQPSTDERAETEHRLVDFKADEVTAIARTGFQPLTLGKGKDSKWSMTGPVRDAADGASVEGFLERVSTARILRRVDQGADAKTLGLAPGKAVWTFTTTSGPVRVEVGGEAALSAGVYAKVGDTSVLLPSSLESLLLKPSSEFRLRELLPVGTQQIQTFSLVRKNGPPLAFQRTPGGFWNVTKPYSDWGSADRLQDALDDVSLCPVFGFVAGKAQDLSKYGLDPARSDMTLTLTGGSTVEVRLGAPVPGSKAERKLVYAWTSDRPSVMEVSLNSLKNLQKAPDSFRSMACFRHDLYNAQEIDITGLYKVRLVRDDKKGWRFAVPAKPAQGSDAPTLAAGISGLRGGTAVPVQGSPPPGLVSPVVAVTLKGKGFEETLKVGAEVDGSRYALPGGRKTALILEKDAWKRVQAALRLVTGTERGTKP